MASIEEEFLTDVETKVKTKSTKRKKSINSKKKGNHGELECVHILNDRFKEFTFARSVQSGAYTGGMNRARASTLTEEQMLVFSGDIRVPKEFNFTIEHKFYAEASFWDLFNDGSDLHAWMEQAQSDADAVGKQPMLVVKYNNKKRIVFIHQKPFEEVFSHRGWNCYWFEDLLKMNDDFFFTFKKEEV